MNDPCHDFRAERATPSFFKRRSPTVRGAYLPLLLGLCASNAAMGAHERVSLDHKVRLSDLIVVGTVISIDDAADPAIAPAPAMNAARAAAVRIERTIKGRAPAETISIPFDTDYKSERQWGVERLEFGTRPEANSFMIGERYMLFLRGLVPPYYATVNWAYGVLHVTDRRSDQEAGDVPRGPDMWVENPRWPAEFVHRMHRFNMSAKRRGDAVREFGHLRRPMKFMLDVPLSEAETAVRAAMAVADRQRFLGRIVVEGSWVPAFLQTGDGETRLVVRMPIRADCPHYDMDRFTVSLRTKEGVTRAVEGEFQIGFAPESVDPMQVTSDASLALPEDVDMANVVGFPLLHRGRHVRLCMPGQPKSACRSNPVVTYCPACGSWQTVRLSRVIGCPYVAPGRPPCGTPVVGEWRGRTRGRRTHRCVACGHEWRARPAHLRDDPPTRSTAPVQPESAPGAGGS